MKKILLIAALYFFVNNIASAQGGSSGNSDWKVPIPLISPQLDPPGSFNQIIVPPTPVIAASSFSSASPALVPAMPPIPALPVIPDVNAVPPVPEGQLTTRTPNQRLLPPLPPIPTSPPVKMPTN